MDLTADPTGVSTSGTPFTTENMNHIEQGIKDNDDRLDQSVKTTDKPTFAGLTWLGVEFQPQLYATSQIKSSFLERK
jgi:hypothetical protein